MKRANMTLEQKWKVFLALNGYPPSYWTRDLDGVEILVTLLEPKAYGKWMAHDEDGESLLVTEEQLDLSEAV